LVFLFQGVYVGLVSFSPLIDVQGLA